MAAAVCTSLPVHFPMGQGQVTLMLYNTWKRWWPLHFEFLEFKQQSSIGSMVESSPKRFIQSPGNYFHPLGHIMSSGNEKWAIYSVGLKKIHLPCNTVIVLLWICYSWNKNAKHTSSFCILPWKLPESLGSTLRDWGKGNSSNPISIPKVGIY